MPRITLRIRIGGDRITVTPTGNMIAIHCETGTGSPGPLALKSVAAQKTIERLLAAIERIDNMSAIQRW